MDNELADYTDAGVVLKIVILLATDIASEFNGPPNNGEVVLMTVVLPLESTFDVYPEVASETIVS